MKILHRIIGRGLHRLPDVLSHLRGSPVCRQSPKRTALTQAGDDSPCSQRKFFNKNQKKGGPHTKAASCIFFTIPLIGCFYETHAEAKTGIPFRVISLRSFLIIEIH